MKTVRVRGRHRAEHLVAGRAADGRCATVVDDGRLCPCREFPDCHDRFARLPRRTPADVARRRTSLVPRGHGKGKGHRGGVGRRRGRHPGSVQASGVFASSQRTRAGSRRRHGHAAAKRHSVPRRHANRLRQRLESVDPGSRGRQGNAVDDGWREGFRLRHGQCGLDQERSAGPRVVPRFAEDCHVPAGSARVGEMYLVKHRSRPSEARRLEVSAARRRERDDDRARRHRRRRPQGRPIEDGTPISTVPRSATTSPAAAASGRTSSGARFTHRRLRLHLPRSQGTTCTSAIRRPASVRDVLQESVATFFESGNGRVNWRYLPASNEAIWFSERDNWGHLYLYDLQTGKLKHPITSGDGNVTQLLRVDEKARVIFFQAVGRENGRDPYFSHFYRVGIDGSNPERLTPEDATHDICCPIGQVLRRQLLEAGRAARHRAARQRRHADHGPREGRRLEAGRGRVEAARRRSSSRRETARPICTG